jgi:HAD superfamily 5'-nucleotidase-like hydrolase
VERDQETETDAAAEEDGRQLALPLPELGLPPETFTIPRDRRVYVNRNLRLSDVEWIGFDMDYTLAIYDQDRMDDLQIRATIPRLLARGYPAFLGQIDFDTRFPIRGLMVDKKLGHVLKMDRYKVVHKAWHGLSRVSNDDVRSLYHQRKIRLTAARYHWVDTLYALAEVTMYAAIIDALEKRGMAPDFPQLFADIRECIDEAHRDGTVLDAVASDFPTFIRRDADLAQALHKWRSSGRKLFLLTNSRASYTDAMMTYLLGGAMPEYPSWRHYFDMVVVAASKPAFFTERRPLMERDGNDLRPATTGPERGRIYEGGNLHEVERMVGVTGDRILYVGDHIFGDILRSKKESSWRTAMIIQEMTDETRAFSLSERDLGRLSDLEEQRVKAEDELRFLQQRFKDVSRQLETFAASGQRSLVPLGVLEAERTRAKKGVERVRTILRSLDVHITELESRVDLRFHPYWGSLLKEANETSSFGSQVEEYACLYTSKVSNFLGYSPLQNFRSPRDKMAHEV